MSSIWVNFSLHLLALSSSQEYSVSQTTLDDVFIHFASEQSEDIHMDHTHWSHPPREDVDGGAVSGEGDHLPDIVPPGNGSRKLTSTGGIIKYTKLQEDLDGVVESVHELWPLIVLLSVWTRTVMYVVLFNANELYHPENIATLIIIIVKIINFFRSYAINYFNTM